MDRLPGLNDGSSPQAQRQRTIEEVEAALEAAEAAEIRRQALRLADCSAFEHPNDSGEEEAQEEAQEEEAAVEEALFVPNPELEPDNIKLFEFKQCAKWAKRNQVPLEKEMVAAVELMHLMDRCGGSIALYEEVFAWHMQHLDTSRSAKCPELFRTLDERCGEGSSSPVACKIFMPHGGADVHLPRFDAFSQIVELLTDPRLEFEDYLFHNNDPASPPPEEFTVLGDVNTGLACRETYRKLIAPEPRTNAGRDKVLLPILLCVDGCTTGDYGNLNLEILKLSLGIFKKEHRRKDHAWKPLGCMEKLLQQSSDAEMMIKESEHIDSWLYELNPNFQKNPLPLEGNTPDFDSNLCINPEDENVQPETPKTKAQDWHKQLQVLLDPLLQLEKRGGFEWDLPCGGKTHRLLFIPFILFWKVDGVEADKLCGQHSAKTKGVKMLCRLCECPTEECDDPHREHPFKTQEKMQRLVATKDRDGLKALSQQFIWNPLYEHQFGLHNKLGIHGATPMEMLHHILLGLFKHARTNFFSQTGPESRLSKELNAVASHIGLLFSRQSDRQVPRTSCTKGVQKGMLMGHEMSGLMLVLVATLRCTKGRNLILQEARGKQKEFLPDEYFIRDWIMCIEMLLQFSEWMKSPELQVDHVERAKLKVKELLNLSKVVGKRSEGMGNKTMNFHGTIHVPDWILWFGVPSCLDTMPNEQHHKRDKRTSKRTNKQKGTFNSSVATKIVQRNSIDMAKEETDNCRQRCHYFELGTMPKNMEGISPDAEGETPVLTGTRGMICRDRVTDEWVCGTGTKMRGKENFLYDDQTVVSMRAVAEYMSDYYEQIDVYTEVKVWDPESPTDWQMHRASPFIAGKPWHDWAVLNLEGINLPPLWDGKDLTYIPSQIKCIFDFTGLENDNGLDMEPSIYALIEPMYPNDDDEFEATASDLFESWKKGPSNTELESGNYIVIVDLMERILEPTTVIPDLDNDCDRACLRMLPLCQWSSVFEEWLEADHTRDFDEPQERQPQT